MHKTIAISLIGTLIFSGFTEAQSFVIPKGMSEKDRKRFERFEKFQIKGVCGDQDLARLAKLGVNTVRGYTIQQPEVMKKKLDEAGRFGINMIVSEWMPHHGENRGKDGGVWNFDYNTSGDKMVENLIKKVEGIGDHPAILMWGFGNEVHLDEPYLRVVNRMSQEVHKRFPHHVTSLTMINAKPEEIEKIKKFAPDLDVLGVQSYSRGAVRGSIKNAEKYWAKPFYVSEFNGNGPWNFKKTEWDVPLDEPVTKKVSDLKDSYLAIDESPLCIGGTVFVWGHHTVGDRPTYFSLLLDPDPEGSKRERFDQMLITPQADVMAEHFKGKSITGNRAPVISKLEFNGGEKSRIVAPGEILDIQFAAEDSNGDRIRFVSWILNARSSRVTTVAGPFQQTTASSVEVKAPAQPGEYLVMVYAKDGKGGASATVLPFKVANASSNSETNSESSPPEN